MQKKISTSQLNGSKLRIGIAVSRWNGEITDALLKSCKQGLIDSKVVEENIKVISVPGAFELPFSATELIKKHNVNSVVCLGCLIKGETMHFEYIAEAVSQGIMRVNTTGDVPVIFGVLTCSNQGQAVERSSGENNHGYVWGQTAVEMALFCKLSDKV
ncbi:MAG: 6,7-dimethyl-8-ribityllumazine synthase [Candidatus Magasanikbacteria bacterium]